MEAGELRPGIERRVSFTLSSGGIVPDQPGCYALTTFSGEIVYIGQTDDLNRRFAEHCGDPDKRVMTPFGVVQFLQFRRCPLSDLNDLESTWTNQYEMRNGGELPYLGRLRPPSG